MPATGDELRAQAKARGLALGPDKWSAPYLKKFGFRVETVFDVGVAHGTPTLYETFPDAHLVLVEPQDIERVVAEINEAYANVSFHKVALGEADGTLELRLAEGRWGLTSAYDRTALTTVDGVRLERREAPMRSLDSLCESEHLTGPFGLKIDTEGFELNVLKGATKTLENTRFVITETSVKHRFEGSYAFSELVAFMSEHGFALLDVLNGHMRSPRFLDCLFVPESDERLRLEFGKSPARSE